MTKIVLREKKLLEEARENYKLLKERFVLLQNENEQLQSGFEKNMDAVTEERENLLTEIDEAKDFISSIISSIEIEQQKREDLFDEFKSTTIADIQNVYQEQLEQLTAELTEFDVITIQNNSENEKLSNQCANLMKQLTAMEREARIRESRIKEEYESQLAELSRKLREDHKDEEKMRQANNDLQAARIECAALKDEVTKLKKEKAYFMEQKESELRTIRDELFNVNREKMDSEISKKRLASEIEALKKSCELSIQRERNLRKDLSKLEHDKLELQSAIRSREFSKDSEITEATANLEMQIKSLEKRLHDNLTIVKNLQNEKQGFFKIEKENETLKEKVKNEANIFSQKISDLENKIIQQRREYDEKLRQIEFDRDHAEKRVNDVMSKSKASIYLAQIEKLREALQSKEDEISQIKSHYRSLLSKMKRAV